MNTPREYEACWTSYTKKGLPEQIAKARCAAMYFKKNGMTVKEAEKRGIAQFTKDDLEHDCDVVKGILGVASMGCTMCSCPTCDKDAGFKAESENDEHKFQGGEIDSGLEYSFVPKDDGTVLVIGTKVGATINTALGSLNWTEDVLEKMTNTWTGGSVGRNHQTFDEGEILLAEYKNGNTFILTKPSPALAQDLGNCIGVSVEGVVSGNYKTKNTTGARGTGITFIFPPKEPACTVRDGCLAIGESEGNVMTKEQEDKLKEVSAKYEVAVAERDEKIVELTTKVAELEKFKAEATGAKKNDSELEAKVKELEAFKAEVVEVKRQEHIASLVKYGVAADTLTDTNVPALVTLLTVAEAASKKAAEERIEDSGVEGTAEDRASAEDYNAKLLKEVNERGY